MLKEINGFKMHGEPYFNDSKWVSPMNFEAGVYDDTIAKSVYIHDVTLRDGEQTTEINWTYEERIEIALLLNELGVKSIEIGMPIISEDIVQASQVLSEMGLTSELIGFCRARTDDIDYAHKAKLKKVIVEHAVNQYTNALAYGVNDDEVVERVLKAIDAAFEYGMKVTFMGWDVTRSPLEQVMNVYRRITERVPVESVVFTDSFGVATPRAIGRAIREFKKNFNVPVEFHVHNEFGMAMGSVTEAVYNGVDGIHASINALGERTGNVATEEVIAALNILLNVPTGTKLELLDKVTTRLSEITRIPVHHNKPVSGRKLFWVESGVVVSAKQRMEAAGLQSAMTPYLPELIGREPTRIVLGGSSGKENIVYYLEKCNLTVDEDYDYPLVLADVKALSRDVRRALTDEEFTDIAIQHGARKSV